MFNPGAQAPLPTGLERPLFGQFLRQFLTLPTSDLSECLADARRAGARLGSVLMSRRLATREDIKQVLKLQARWVATARQADLDRADFPFPTYFSLCMPAYNEEANITDTLDGATSILPEFVSDFEVIVVDDGSSDDTGKLVAKYSETDPRVKLVSHEQNMGYGAAVRSGLRAAEGELVAFTDSDGQFSLLDLPQLLTRIVDNDLVIGYRYHRADPWRRRLNAWAWTRLMRLVLGVKVRDMDCAFKLFTRPVVDSLCLTSDGACVNAEMMVQCKRDGRKLIETPVLHYPRQEGEQTGANLQVILRAFRELPRLFRYRRQSKRASRRGGEDSRQSGLKICMLAACPFPANHGTPGSIREMSEALVEEGHDVHIVTYDLGEDIPVRGPEVHRIKPLLKQRKVVVGPTVLRPLYDFQMVFKALAVLRREKFDVIHAHGYEAALIAWVCRLVTGLPVVYSAHNTMIDELPTYEFIKPKWLATALARILDRFVPRLADRCIPHSKALETFLHGMGLSHRTDPVIPFGINLDDAMRGDGSETRERYALGEGPVISYCGVMDEFQRLDLLLEAMVDVVRVEPRAKLLIIVTIASERHLSRVRSQVEELGMAANVMITERKSLQEGRECLLATDVSVVPRPQVPGFPIKLINSMAAAKPCVLFASSGAGLTHRENAILAHADTSSALAAGILELCADPALRERIAKNALEYVRGRHDRRLTAKGVISSCCRAVGRDPARLGGADDGKTRDRPEGKPERAARRWRGSGSAPRSAKEIPGAVIGSEGRDNEGK